MTRGRTRLARSGCISALVLIQLAIPALVFASGYGSGPGPIPTTPYSGFDPTLVRAPYVTDLTQTSAQVTWATTSSTTGSLAYGPTGNCTQNTVAVPSVTAVTVSPANFTPVRRDYQSSVTIGSLSPGTAYCYEIFGSGPTSDLLAPTQPFQTFTTLDPPDIHASTPLTFAVVADFGETSNRGTDTSRTDPSAVNTNQSAIMSLIGSSNPRFVVGVGDIAYADGSSANYGDLEETGAGVGSTETSDIFGPSYWPLTGGIPMYAAIGNHGQNTNAGLLTWPERNTTAANPGAVYDMRSYSGVDGITSASYPTGYYAFSSGNVRMYVLDASWNDCTNCNFGTATGDKCPDLPNSSNCKGYQVDADAHFAASSPEYTWLAADLHAHPGGIKLAFWHYPLRSDNATADSDVYLQAQQGGLLEPLLAQNGVNIVFNGHAHDYERNTTAGPNTVISYVTGGGGGIINPVAGHAGNPCSPWDAYAVGWAYNASIGGSRCGNAPLITSDAQAFNFLEVTVQGTQVTVTPIDAAGETFDQQRYTFTPPVPSAPSNVTAVATSARAVQLSWGASTETGDYVSSYQITRNGSAITTVPAAQTSYTDTGLQPNTAATYTVTAVDAAGNSSPPGTSNQVTTPLFFTDFESENLSGWSRVVGGVTVYSQQTQPSYPPPHNGSLYAVSLTGANSQSYALQNLPSASTALYAQGFVQASNQTTTATLLGLRTQTAQVAQVYLSGGTIKVLDNVSHASYLSSTALPSGSWHQVTLSVNESAGTMQVWVDSLPVQFATPSGRTYVISGQNFGSPPAPMSVVQLGDDSTSRTYAWYADDVTVSTVQPFTTPGPSTPGSVTATATTPTSVQVNWAASSEPGGAISAYQVSRSGTQIATVQAPTTSYGDTTLQPGASATYTVTAIDSYGTASQPGTSNAVTTPLFTAGFETGNLTGWTTVHSVAVQNQVIHSGSNAASLNAAAGSQSFATQNLPSSSAVLYAQGWVYVASQSTTLTLFGLRTQTGQVARVFLQANGVLSVANNADPSHPSYVGNVSIAPGSWHQVTFAANETAGTMQVWLDGTPVKFNTGTGSVTGQNLGTTPMSNFQLGDDSTQHTYSWYADDITVATYQPPF